MDYSGLLFFFKSSLAQLIASLSSISQEVCCLMDIRRLVECIVLCHEHLGVYLVDDLLDHTHDDDDTRSLDQYR